MRADVPDGQRLLPRLTGLAAGLRCAPAEAAALAVLLAGAGVALLLLWRLGAPAPVPDGGAVPVLDGDAVPVLEPVAILDEEIVVHVAGLVAAPGLYRLAGGTRVADALEAAGGPLPEAALDGVNLARPLTDGEQLLVPAAGAAVPDAPSGTAAPAPAARRPDGTLDLNLATQSDLEELPGIGPVMAQRILEHREEIGRFQAVGDLRQVVGIGEKTFQKLAPLVGT
jgi:competence protein ComEA